MDSLEQHEVVGQTNTWGNRHPFLVLVLTPLLATLTGSAFNIWYNLSHIEPLLNEIQVQRFHESILWFNVVVYPPLIIAWALLVRSLYVPYQKCLKHVPDNDPQIERARSRVINIPWYAAALCGVGWLLCIPALNWGLNTAPGDLNPHVRMHLSVSILVAMLISITHGFFIVELVSQKLIFPVIFRNSKPADTPGTITLSLRLRGLLWAISIGACPITSLILLGMVDAGERSPWFALAVGVLGVVFGLISAWMLGRLVAKPIEALIDAAQSVARGNLDVQIDLLRADEFGPLIDEFNHMVGEMREKQVIRETFGAHVGQDVAREILAHDAGLSGVAQDISVLFCDIREFTARSAQNSPEEMVAILNQFFEKMVAIIEEPEQNERALFGADNLPRDKGMVNQFLGDGFMALFGVGGKTYNHGVAAVSAGCVMLEHMRTFNQTLKDQGRAPIQVGIGVNSGPAVVGSLGSPQRMQYTAIGDTANVASRVEGLTKVVGKPLVFTQRTRDMLPEGWPICPLEPQRVKGQADPIKLYTIEGLTFDRQEGSEA